MLSKNSKKIPKNIDSLQSIYKKKSLGTIEFVPESSFLQFDEIKYSKKRTQFLKPINEECETCKYWSKCLILRPCIKWELKD